MPFAGAELYGEFSCGRREQGLRRHGGFEAGKIVSGYSVDNYPAGSLLDYGLVIILYLFSIRFPISLVTLVILKVLFFLLFL